MKSYLTILIMGITSVALAQNAKYGGILIDPETIPDFENGKEAITASIRENLSHLNLFEYAHALPELYPLIEDNVISESQWKSFVDSLEEVASSATNDSINPYWANEYVGLIPLQAQFFIATLDKNEKLQQTYRKAYRILKENTSQMTGLGYSEEDFDTLIKITEVVGETNFWYFFQLEDCHLIESWVKKDKDRLSILDAITSSMDITSTYKVPFYLQKRKWLGLQNRLKESESMLCHDLAENMDNISIGIRDKDRTYFDKYKKEGLDYSKMKDF